MIIDNPVVRIVLKAISACGLIAGQRDSTAGRSNPVQQRDSPFVLVAHAPDGRWGVFERDFEIPLAAFDELRDACNHANELSRTRMNSIVLIRKGRDPAADQDSSRSTGTV